MRYLIFLFLFLPLATSAQVVNTVDVRIKLKEKVADQIKTMANANLVISDIGEATTNDAGEYIFTYPVRNAVEPIISIGLLSDDHKMLRPVDGSIQLDTGVSEMQVEFLVINMESETPALKKRIAGLEKRISGLKQENNFTLQQINALNNTLLDTILFFEANRLELENKIADYQETTTEQSEEINELRGQLSNLASQVDQLTQDLEDALEKKYLRQNEHFKAISANLITYLRKAKDLRDHLPFMSAYFNSPTGYTNFDQDIRGYNTAYEAFDNDRLSYLEGVDRYWSNPALTKKLEEVFDFLGKAIHQNQILPVVNDINQELHKQKPKKAQKIATLAHEDMAVNIRALEQQINRTLSQLRKNI